LEERVGKVILKLDHYQGTDLYSDGPVEDELLEIVKSVPEEEYPRVIAERASWPVLYHLSPVRRNLVEWIDFRKYTDTVLEIGSGLGAITGVLAEKAKQVVCVELSKRRSMVNAVRHQEQDNIEIHVGNFEDIESSLPQFDVVTLIGVLEYAQSYLHSQEPYMNMLQAAWQHLKPGGRLILAIENKLGMKYWAGCHEDHTGRLFDSIENYPERRNIRTFSKKELGDLLEAAGYCHLRFYYPYPDYKLPSAIYSDSYLPSKGTLTQNMRNFDQERVVLFDEAKAYDAVLDAGLFPEFSNSFLIIGERSGERS